MEERQVEFRMKTTEPLDSRSKVQYKTDITKENDYYVGFDPVYVEDEGLNYKVTGEDENGELIVALCEDVVSGTVENDYTENESVVDLSMDIPTISSEMSVGKNGVPLFVTLLNRYNN